MLRMLGHGTFVRRDSQEHSFYARIRESRELSPARWSSSPVLLRMLIRIASGSTARPRRRQEQNSGSAKARLNAPLSAFHPWLFISLSGGLIQVWANCQEATLQNHQNDLAPRSATSVGRGRGMHYYYRHLPYILGSPGQIMLSQQANSWTFWMTPPDDCHNCSLASRRPDTSFVGDHNARRISIDGQKVFRELSTRHD